MIGLRELCALLIGGAVSVPATVAVVEKRAEPNAPAKRVALPLAKPPTICIEDWPGVGLGDFTGFETGPGPIPVLPAGPGGKAQWQPGPNLSGPWGPWPLPGGPDVSIPPAAIPEPAQWLMLLAGFGLVGLSMRRRRR